MYKCVKTGTNKLMLGKFLRTDACLDYVKKVLGRSSKYITEILPPAHYISTM